MTGAADRHLILGFPRSGTTLLSRLIDAHPEISSPPETFMFSSAARFLAEQSAVEGPPIGVLSGLAFAGFEPEEVMGPLRAMLFGWHAGSTIRTKGWPGRWRTGRRRSTPSSIAMPPSVTGCGTRIFSPIPRRC